MTVDYRVRLEAFEGPLDLLLFLIRRAEVDITDIPIATIADQYVRHLQGLERIDIELAGEFLVMAATLMEIKSRMLAPRGARDQADALLGDAPDGEDPRAELVRQLLEFKKYRDAAGALEQRRHEWERRFPNSGGLRVGDEQLQAMFAERAADLDLEDLSLVDLVEAFGRIISSVNFERLGDHTVTYDDTPIELHAEDILDRLRRDSADGREVPLDSLFTGRTRSEMIGLFLATLELVRRRAISVRQADAGGPVAIAVRPPEDVEPTGA